MGVQCHSLNLLRNRIHSRRHLRSVTLLGMTESLYGFFSASTNRWETNLMKQCRSIAKTISWYTKKMYWWSCKASLKVLWIIMFDAVNALWQSWRKLSTRKVAHKSYVQRFAISPLCATTTSGQIYLRKVTRHNSTSNIKDWLLIELWLNSKHWSYSFMSKGNSLMTSAIQRSVAKTKEYDIDVEKRMVLI